MLPRGGLLAYSLMPWFAGGADSVLATFRLGHYLDCAGVKDGCVVRESVGERDTRNERNPGSRLRRAGMAAFGDALAVDHKIKFILSSFAIVRRYRLEQAFGRPRRRQCSRTLSPSQRATPGLSDLRFSALRLWHRMGSPMVKSGCDVGAERAGARLRSDTTQESKNILASALSGGPRIIFSGTPLVSLRENHSPTATSFRRNVLAAVYRSMSVPRTASIRHSANHSLIACSALPPSRSHQSR